MSTPEEIKNGLKICRGECAGNRPYCPYDKYGNGCEDTLNRDALAYIHLLENHINELTERVAQPRWISVEERLPEENGKYIVCTAKGSVYCTKFSIGVHGSFHTDMYTHISHWMPLPEPPKEAK